MLFDPHFFQFQSCRKIRNLPSTQRHVQYPCGGALDSTSFFAEQLPVNAAADIPLPARLAMLMGEREICVLATAQPNYCDYAERISFKK